MNAKPGWFETDDPKWLRWWDGKRWRNAYWPVRVPAQPYLPDAARVDISSGWPSVDIVGENYRGGTIAWVLGGMPERDVEVEQYVTAELVPEPDNPHSRKGNAISVRIRGAVVGYLPDDDAAEYWPILTRFVSAGQVPVVDTRIWGVTRWVGGTRGLDLKSAIRVALPPADAILPANPAPESEHRVLPRGRSLQVTGEEKHADVLSPYSQGGEPTTVVVTLHALTVPRAKSEVTVVEVRLDGERIGQLTPGSSTPLLSVIESLEQRGQHTAAWAQVTGSRFAAEVKLSICKPEEIPDSWPRDSDRIPTVSTQAEAPPPAWIDDSPVETPPSGANLPWWGWASIVLAFVLLVQIPYVGPILGLVAVGFGIYWAIWWKRKPSPKARRTAPNPPSSTRA